MMKVRLTLELEAHQGAGEPVLHREHIPEYVELALRCYIGSLQPEDPFFHVARHSIKVRLT